MAPNPVTIISRPLPGNEQITKKFLQMALEKEANGDSVPKILSHTTTLGTKPGDNYMSIIYATDVKLGNGTTRHLIIKCYPNHPSYQIYANNSNIFFKECQIYSKWIPELRRLQNEVLGLDEDQGVKLPYAHFLHGECIDFQSIEGEARKSGLINPLDNFIIMEDIRKTSGFRMTNRREPLDIDHTRLVIEALAKVHSLSWAYRHHVESSITGKFPYLLETYSNKDLEGGADFVNSNLNQAIRIYDEEFGYGNEYSALAKTFRNYSLIVAKSFLGKDAVWNKLDNMMISGSGQNKIFGSDVKNPEPWRIICHGDCWSNNLLFRYDPDTGKPCEVVLVDLQAAQESCVVNDLEYVIHACTDLKLRRTHTDELLELYHDTFNDVCKLLKTPTLPGFNMDSLRYRYHRGKLFGFYVAMMCLPIMLSEEQCSMDLEEHMESDKDISEIFAKLTSNFASNLILKKRLIGLTQGMIEDGVL